MSTLGLLPILFLALFGLIVVYGCFVLAGFVARRFEKTSSGILIGGLAGLGAFVVLNIVLSFVMSGVFLAAGVQ